MTASLKEFFVRRNYGNDFRPVQGEIHRAQVEKRVAENIHFLAVDMGHRAGGGVRGIAADQGNGNSVGRTDGKQFFIKFFFINIFADS